MRLPRDVCPDSAVPPQHLKYFPITVRYTTAHTLIVETYFLFTSVYDQQNTVSPLLAGTQI
jgi:hypothetical protein